MDEIPFPVVTGAQMAAVDAAMSKVCGLDLVQVMETAGRAVAVVVRHRWRQLGARGTVAILCGSGGNGGDGFVCGRYLYGWGIPVELWLMRSPDELTGLARHQLDVCRKIGMTMFGPAQPPAFENAALIVDALFGFGFSKAPAGRAAELIEAANAASAPILAIDIPSGIDSTTGDAPGIAIRAALTVTLGLPKQGLLQGAGPTHAGEMLVADIGIPAAAYAAANVPETEVFRDAEFRVLNGMCWRADEP
jgi:NAD(P)H-hydrate epimerase